MFGLLTRKHAVIDIEVPPVETLEEYINRHGSDKYGAALVRDAATLLDKRAPGWRRKVDLASFDISDPEACILHYVFGDYSKGKSKLFGSSAPAVSYAFSSSRTADHWRTEILKGA